MIKVRILDRCEFCEGKAYIFDYQDVDARGEVYDRYRPCEMCHGSGNQAKWISLREFADLLERAISITTNFHLFYVAGIITTSVRSPNL